MNATTQAAPEGAVKETRSLDVLWEEALKLQPTNIEIESPALYSPGRVAVTLRFERGENGDDRLRLTSERQDVRAAFEDVIAKAMRYAEVK